MTQTLSCWGVNALAFPSSVNTQQSSSLTPTSPSMYTPGSFEKLLPD